MLVEALEVTESVEFWRLALVRSLVRLVSDMLDVKRGARYSLNRTVLEGAGVSGATGLDLEADALVLTQAGGGGSSGLRHDEECCE